MVDYKTVGKIAVLEIKNLPVNALSIHVRQGIKAGLQRAISDNNIKALVISGRERFIAGADIKEFDTGVSRNSPTLTELTFAIEDCPKPVVAGIRRYALGGGLEVALSCHYRIAHHDVQLGFPEVDIGLLPGATGTQRFPRVVGLEVALNVISTGRRFDAEEGRSFGVIDLVTSSDDIIKTAVEFAESIADKPFRHRRTSHGSIQGADTAQRLMESALELVKKRFPGAVAPVFCIKSVMAAAKLPREEGLDMEHELFDYVMKSYQSSSLQYAFFAERMATKWEIPGASYKTTRGTDIRTGGIVGAGTMGTGIAMVMLNAGIPVVMVDQDQKNLDRGVKILKSLYDGSVKLKKLTREEADTRLSMLTPTVNYEDLKSVDMVIEAVYEKMDVKKEVFKKLDKVCKPEAYLWSNTSYLNIDEIASVTSRPDKVLGAHFFVPAYYMRLLENVRGKLTSPETIATATKFGTRIGKVPVLVGNCHGFVGNRMQAALSREAGFMVEEGCLPGEVDHVSETFGFPLGVLKINDLSGHDIGHLTNLALAARHGVTLTPHTRYINGQRYSPLVDILVSKGRLGRKVAKGWYRYDKPNAKIPYDDEEVTQIIMEYCKEAGIERRKFRNQEILERLLYGVINEGFKLLEEGIASKPEDIDTIWMLGYAWPRHYGGPMYYANMVGLNQIYERISHYYRTLPTVSHWQPSRLLRTLAKNKVPMRDWNKFLNKADSKL